MNYYRRFPGDYIRDTLRLTFIEDCAYSRLLDHLYAVERPIENLTEAVRITRARTKREKKATENVLMWYFVFSENGYTNKRFEEEVKYAESRRKVAIENGKKGGRPKPSGLANPNPQESYSRLQTPETSNSTTEREALADWIPLSLWSDYRTMREKMKRPLTSGAVDILVEDLRKLRDAGEDVSEVLKQAIAGGWFAFRAIRKEKVNGTIESFEERRQRKSAEAIGAVRGRVDEVLRKVEPTPRLESGEQTPDSRLRRGPN